MVFGQVKGIHLGRRLVVTSCSLRWCYHFIKPRAIFFISREKVSLPDGGVLSWYKPTLRLTVVCANHTKNKKAKYSPILSARPLQCHHFPNESPVCGRWLNTSLQLRNYVQSAAEKTEPLWPILKSPSVDGCLFVSLRLSLISSEHLLRRTGTRQHTTDFRWLGRRIKSEREVTEAAVSGQLPFQLGGIVKAQEAMNAALSLC